MAAPESEKEETLGQAEIDNFTCSLCLDIFCRPITVECGHTFCDVCLEQHLNRAKHRTCPVCRKPIPAALPRVSLVLRNAVETRFGCRRHGTVVESLNDELWRAAKGELKDDELQQHVTDQFERETDVVALRARVMLYLLFNHSRTGGGLRLATKAADAQSLRRLISDRTRRDEINAMSYGLAMVQKGASDVDVIFTPSEGETTLMIFASKYGAVEAVKALLTAGADHSLVDSNGHSALYNAAKHGHTETVRVLLAAGADHSLAPCGCSATALHMAAVFNFPETVQALLDGGASHTAVDQMGCTPLMGASVRPKSVDAVRVLLAAGACHGAVDEHGVTALMQCAMAGSLPMLQALLDGGASHATTSEHGMTALLWAAKLTSDACTVQALLAAGASHSAVNENGSDALIIAAHKGNTRAVQALLAGGASHATKNKSGSSALLYSASQGHVHCVHALLKAGASPAVATHDGETALVYATREGHLDVVVALLNAGASHAPTDTRGKTALWYAEKSGHAASQEIVKVLKAAGATNSTVR
jgi:ankyrin repeat protein